MRRSAAALLLLLAAAAQAAVPQRLNYQGKLADASGNPLSGTYSFRFKLFSAETGGSALFTEAVDVGNAVSVVNGIYSVQIGSYTAGGIPYGVFDNQHLYLEIDVAAGISLASAETLTPRERLNAAPWAVHALGAERLGTAAVIATFTATGALQLPSGSTITAAGTLSLSTAASAALSGKPAIFLDADGEVGLGTNAPIYRLDVVGDEAGVDGHTFAVRNTNNAAGAATSMKLITAGAAAGNPFAHFTVTGVTDWTMGIQNNDADKFKITPYFVLGEAPGLTLDVAGRVGVSTGSPQTTLDVNGDAQFGTGALKSTFTATPSNTVYALRTSSGVRLNAGGVVAAFFEGMHKGDGSRLTGVSDLNKVSKAGDTMTGDLSFDYNANHSITGSDMSTPGTPGINLTIRAGNATPSGLASANGGSLYLTAGTDDGANSQGGSVYAYGAAASGGASTLAGNVYLGYNGSAAVGAVAVGHGSPVYPLDVGVETAFGAPATKSVFLTSGQLTIASNANLLMPGASGKLGIGTSVPVTALDVSSAARFGAGATKSTFTATPGGTTFALQTSSGVFVASGPVYLNGAGGHFRFPDGTTMASAGVAKTGDNMTGPLTLNNASITVVNTGGASMGFGLAVTTATNRSVYNLYVSTYGNVGVNFFNNDVLVDPLQVRADRNDGTVVSMINAVNGTDARIGFYSFSATGEGGVLLTPSAHTFFGSHFADRLAVVGPGNAQAVGGLGVGGVDVIAADPAGDVRFYTNGIATTNERMRLNAGGRLGIGTTGPTARLHVASATTNTNDNMVLVTTGAVNLFRVQANGNVYAHGAFLGGGADLAEMYPAEPGVEPGHVVELAPDGRLRLADERSRRVMGVVSSSPGTLLGWDIQRNEMPGHRPLALAGRVPVRFSPDAGPVRRGDALAPSATPGVARRAAPGELAVAVALEDADASGTVMGYVRAADAETSEQLRALREENAALRRDLDELRRAVLPGK